MDKASTGFSLGILVGRSRDVLHRALQRGRLPLSSTRGEIRCQVYIQNLGFKDHGILSSSGIASKDEPRVLWSHSVY